MVRHHPQEEGYSYHVLTEFAEEWESMTSGYFTIPSSRLLMFEGCTQLLQALVILIKPGLELFELLELSSTVAL